MENENEKRKARRRSRNSKIPDPFRRAAETDNTLRNSSPGDAPSSRSESSSVRPPSSRRASQAGKRPHEITDAGAARSLDTLEVEAPAPASERRSSKISERRPKLIGADGAPAQGEVATLPASVGAADAPRAIEGSPGKRGKVPLFVIGIAAVGIAGAAALLGWMFRAPKPESEAQPASGEVAADQAQAVLPPSTTAPPPEAPSAAPPAAQEASNAAASEEEPTDAKGKKKKKKKGTATAAGTGTAKAPPAKTATTPTPVPTTSSGPAFTFKFE